MSDTKEFGTAKAIQSQSTHCGLRPSQKAMEEGFSVDFSQAKTLLVENSQAEGSNTAPKSTKTA